MDEEDVSDDTQLLMKCMLLALKYFPITNAQNGTTMSSMNQSALNLLTNDPLGKLHVGSQNKDDWSTMHPSYADASNAG